MPEVTAPVTTKRKGKGAKPSVVEEQAEGRPVLYPDFESHECVGDKAFTVEKAIELMGLTHDEAHAKEHGCEAPLFLDRQKKPVYALNNINNRPVNFGRVEDLVQEIKFSAPTRPIEQRRWQFNSEPIIVGRTGLILNGQKQMIAMFLAEQDRTGPSKYSWEMLGWEGPIQIEKVVNFGLEEKDEITDTLDLAQPRSLSDVIYRSQHFSRFKPEARKVVSRMADYAIRLLWDRTGVGYRPRKGDVGTNAPRRTVTESMDFLRRHPRLLDAIRVVWEEYGKDEKLKFNRERMSPGYASALLYLMGTSTTDGERNSLGQLTAYAEKSDESVLNFELWDAAKEFWTCLTRMPVDGNVVCPQFQEVLDTFADVAKQLGVEKAGVNERIAILSLAWSHFAVGSDLVRAQITPEWVTNDKGTRTLIEAYPIGGIDLGHNPRAEEEESAVVSDEPSATGGDGDEPTPEEKEAQNAERQKIDSARVAEVQQRLREAAERRRKQQEERS